MPTTEGIHAMDSPNWMINDELNLSSCVLITSRGHNHLCALRSLDRLANPMSWHVVAFSKGTEYHRNNKCTTNIYFAPNAGTRIFLNFTWWFQ